MMKPMNAVIHLTDLRTPRLPEADLPLGGEPVRDTRGRPLRDLRISVTDRCNFRCTYCMPREVFDSDYAFMPHSSLLSFEEIERLARLFVQLGTEKIRLTGGEPLLRKNIETLIGMLSALRTPQGEPLDLTLTTNGSLLARKARALADAGLKRVTVSLDALDAARFATMSDSRVTPDDVLRGIDAAADAGLTPVKVNMVVRRGLNDDQILPMARRFRGSGHVLRFIEYMDVGSTNGWNLTEVVPSAEVIRTIAEHYPLEPCTEPAMGRVAQRWRYADGAGEIGVISSVTEAFCEGCTRARLSPEGKLYLCLFSTGGYDLRDLVRGGADDTRIQRVISGIWRPRADNYSESRTMQGPADADGRIEMSYIGG